MLMEREELELAIAELQTLLDANENREQSFQHYFENNKVVFDVMGYQAAHPLKHLPLDEEMKAKTGVTYLEPDFILQRRNSIYEILDLKTPQEKLIRDIPNRETFYSKINEYISQVGNYSEYFDDKANRDWVKKSHSIDVHKDPDVTIVAAH